MKTHRDLCELCPEYDILPQDHLWGCREIITRFSEDKMSIWINIYREGKWDAGVTLCPFAMEHLLIEDGKQ